MAFVIVITKKKAKKKYLNNQKQITKTNQMKNYRKIVITMFIYILISNLNDRDISKHAFTPTSRHRQQGNEESSNK